MDLSAKEIIAILDLKPHPTCGLVKQTYVSQIILPKNVLPSPFNSNRSVGSVLYFMVTQETEISLHKICSDQMYHFYMGSPLEVFLLYPNGHYEIKLMGHELKKGMIPQLLIPADTFHTSKLYDKNSYALLGTSEWIGVEPEDVILGNFSELIKQYPNCKEELTKFIK
ncbi:cupin domain-containing protein [Legionella cardiaca]|uniref:Cupin domain-containing protein n=1 Tax=Legionella cardiaca TaxID=1071983 RepID=A0ABY8ATA4_9GAMM|nr:cupin domain-containing protein [Legionella cardiaca]WED42372.1 cupin domain-containing protein [Legionella cardiaca]